MPSLPADNPQKQPGDTPVAEQAATADEDCNSNNKTSFSTKEDLETGDTTKETAESPDGDKDKPSAQNTKPLIEGKQMLGVMVAIALSMFLATLDATIVSTMVPKIAERFEALANATWIVSAYVTASTALQPIYGKLCNIYGHQRVLFVSHAFFMAGSIICGAAKSANMLIAGRAVAGIGGSGLIAIGYVVIGDFVPTAKSPMYLSIVGMVWAVSSVAGPVLGGVFADRTGFQWGFYINPCIQALVLVFMAVFMRLPKPQGSAMQKLKRVDFAGVSVVVSGIVLIQLGLIWGGREYKWNSAAVVCSLVLGVVLLVVFGLVEWKIPVEPIMPLRLFNHRNVSLMFVGQVAIGFVFFMPIFYLPIYLTVVQNASAISSGLHLVSCMLSMSIFTIIAGVLITKTGKYMWCISIGACFITAGIGLFAILDVNPTNSQLIGIPILFGAGIGFVIQPTTVCIQNSVSPEDVATTTTLFTTTRQLGGSVGLAIAQSIIQNRITPKLDALAVKYPAAQRVIYGVLDNQAVIWMPSVPKTIRDEIIHAYVESLQMAYLIFIAFGGITLVVSLFAKNIPLRKTLGPAIAE
ncbi:hypothetical protein GGI12_003470 [Dipsacomyces acuminosporus]|nr:hypothetical protein GGI12_003470 [Dipsacomyces acuminosporus]